MQHGLLVLVVRDPSAPPPLEVDEQTAVDEVERQMRANTDHGVVAMARANAALRDVGFEPVSGVEFGAAVVGVARQLLSQRGREN